MDLLKKNYKAIKVKNYIKTNNLFLIFNGVNQKADSWVTIEQELKRLDFKYYKIFNRITKKSLTNSIFDYIKPSINGITVFIKQSSIVENLSLKAVSTKFKPMLLTLIAVKLNNKVYATRHFKTIYTFNYRETQLLLLQFLILNKKLQIVK